MERKISFTNSSQLPRQIATEVRVAPMKIATEEISMATRKLRPVRL